MAPSTTIEPERYELSEARRYTFELERRDFMRLFGGGLRRHGRGGGSARAGVRARAAAGARRHSRDLAAWLHIDETGRVHVCTGKVEIGQNIRTSLAQTVADELRVPLASITMVMADTDKMPFDQGTFGSLTTPRMAPQLAKAAATAREMLIDQAAARWQVDRATLTARDGQHRRGRRPRARLRRADERAGADRARFPRRRAVEPRDKWQLRGTAPKKVNGARLRHRRATSTRRTSRAPACCYGRIVRPDGYGGTLVSVDDARARAMPA